MPASSATSPRLAHVLEVIVPQCVNRATQFNELSACGFDRHILSDGADTGENCGRYTTPFENGQPLLINLRAPLGLRISSTPLFVTMGTGDVQRTTKSMKTIFPIWRRSNRQPTSSTARKLPIGVRFTNSYNRLKVHFVRSGVTPNELGLSISIKPRLPLRL